MLKIFILIFCLAIITSGVILFTPYKSFIEPEVISLNIKNKFTQVAPSETPQQPTLERIFSSDRKTAEGKNLITLIATGDVIPARSTNFQTSQRNDFTWPWQKTADVLKSADITFINLETPLMQNCQLINEGMSFCGSSKNIEGLLYGGVDVASLGNNHSANYGKPGLDETKKLLEDNGILVTGLNGPVYNDILPYVTKEVKGIKFAFLAYTDIAKTPLVSSAEENKIAAEVAEAKRNADVVIVQYHWGTEYITPPEQRQIDLGKLTIDSGADLVIGNHPHWIKPIQFYKGKLITYGHGNFIFDQEWSQKTKEGVVGKYTFDGKNLIDVEYMPVEIINYGQPYFIEGDFKKKILNEMLTESQKLK